MSDGHFDVSEGRFDVSGTRFDVSGGRFSSSGSRFDVSGGRFSLARGRFDAPADPGACPAGARGSLPARIDNLQQHQTIRGILSSLPQSQDLRLLVTSRHTLGAEFESIKLAELKSPYDRRLLLLSAGLNPEQEDLHADADRLCKLLCHFPLALELAGAYLNRGSHLVTIARYAKMVEGKGLQTRGLDEAPSPGPDKANCPAYSTGTCGFPGLIVFLSLQRNGGRAPRRTAGRGRAALPAEVRRQAGPRAQQARQEKAARPQVEPRGALGG